MSTRLFALRILTVSLVVFTFPLGLHAQTQLAGQVVDSQGRAVPNATIVLVGPTAAPLTMRSDDEGRFVVSTLAEGGYDLTAAAPGLVGEARGISLNASSPVSIVVTMRVSAVSEALVVSASQIDQPLSRTADSVTVISGEDLDVRQVTSLAQALSPIAGFTVARSGGPGTLTSIFPRGGESDFTLVLVDGIRANAFGGGVDLSQVPLADVARIEVVRGPQSSVYGADAIGGVVQVITRQGGTPTVTGLIEGGSRATRRLKAATSGSLSAFRWQAGADFFADDGFTGVAPANGEVVSNDDARERQAWMGGGWRGARGTDVQAVARYVDTRRGAPGPYGSDPAGQFFGVDRTSRGSTDRTSVGLRAMHPWGGPSSRVRQRFELDVADYDLQFVSPFGESESQTRRIHGRIQTDAVFNGGLGASGGVEWIAESGRSSFIRGADAVVPVERRIIGTFGEARWNALERVSVQAGIRAEHITRESFAVNGFADDNLVSINPKVAISWLVSPALPSAGAGAWTRVRASAGTGIRPPDMFEIAFTDNPDLAPERSRSIEVGATQTFAGGALQLDAAAFFNRYDDLIISVGSLGDVSRYLTDNISNARARGMELSAAWHGRRGVSARASYTFLDTEIREIDGTGQAPSPFAVGDPLLRRPRHQGAVTATWSGVRGSLFTNVAMRGQTLDAEPTLGASGGLYSNAGHAVMDIGGSLRVARRVDGFVRVMNLFNRAFEEILGYPAPGRTAFAGVRIAARR
jgi:outer membrane cobalamin receptor